jgi:hypothetical protein
MSTREIAAYVIKVKGWDEDDRPVIAEQRPGRVRQAVRLTVPAPEQVDYDIVGQVLDWMLDRVRSKQNRLARVSNDKVRRGKPSGWGNQARADITETITVVSGGRQRIKRDCLRRQEIGKARGMHAQHQEHGREQTRS